MARTKVTTVSATAVVCGLLAVLCVLAIIGGEPMTGLIGLVVIGGAGALCVWVVRGRWSPPSARSRLAEGAVRHGTLAKAGRYSRHSTGVVFPARRRIALFTLAGSALFVAFGGWFLARAFLPGTRMPGGRGEEGLLDTVFLAAVGVLAVVVFATFGIAALRALLGPGGGVGLLPDGVYFRAPTGSGWARWQDLESVWEVAPTGPGGSGAHLALRARTPDAFVLTGLNRWFHRVNRSRYGMDAGFPSAYLRAPAAVVVAEIRRYCEDVDQTSQLADPAVLDQVGVRVPGPSRPPPTPAWALRRLRKEFDRSGDPVVREHLLEALVGAWHIEEIEERLSNAEAHGEVEPRVFVAQAMLAAGRGEQAEAHLRHARGLGSVEAAVVLAGHCAATSRPQEAEALYRQAQETGHPAAIAGLGHLYYDQGRPEEARRWWLRAAELGDFSAIHALADEAAAT